MNQLATQVSMVNTSAAAFFDKIRSIGDQQANPASSTQTGLFAPLTAKTLTAIDAIFRTITLTGTVRDSEQPAFGVQYDAVDPISFIGDNDLWVFVDGKLAMGIGGVQGALTDSFTGQDLINDLLLSEGTNYDINIFFAERHTVASSFSITTTVGISPPQVPLPAGLPLLLGGIAAFGFMRRRQSSQTLFNLTE